MKRSIVSKFLQPKPKIENKGGFSSSTWSKNFRRLHRRHKIMRSAGANDVETKSTNLQIMNSDQVEMESTDLQIANSDQVETESTNLQIMNSDQVEMESTDLQIVNSDQVEIESTDLQIINSDQVEMESTDLQILNSGEIEVDPTSLNSDVIAITGNRNGYESGDDDIELQQILFYSAQFHSGKNLESSSNHSVGKKPVEIEYSVFPNSLNLKKSTTKMGESSRTYCVICENVFSLPNTMMRGSNCNHRYCEECIQNYIGKKINKDIHEMIAMKCPASDCKGILDIDSIMPVDFLMRLRDVFRLTEVLASPIVIDCPFMDCMGTLVDDLREYPIRACPKCWRLFCVNCKCLHLGMTCEIYQFSRQLNLLYWQQQYGGYHDELEEDEEEEEDEDEDEDDDDEEGGGGGGGGEETP